jgi:hypothetical protein
MRTALRGGKTLAGEAARRWAVPEQSGKQDRSRRRQQMILAMA